MCRQSRKIHHCLLAQISPQSLATRLIMKRLFLWMGSDFSWHSGKAIAASPKLDNSHIRAVSLPNLECTPCGSRACPRCRRRGLSGTPQRSHRSLARARQLPQGTEFTIRKDGYLSSTTPRCTTHANGNVSNNIPANTITATGTPIESPSPPNSTGANAPPPMVPV